MDNSSQEIRINTLKMPLPDRNENDEQNEDNPNLEDECDEIDERVFRFNDYGEDVVHVRSVDLEVDNNNQAMLEKFLTNEPIEEKNLGDEMALIIAASIISLISLQCGITDYQN